MILYYVRHGDPIYNPDSLTELGHKQAKALAKRFSLYGLDEIYSSPSNRAMQTARYTSEALGLEMKICEWADEGKAWEDMTVITQDGRKTWGFADARTVARFNDAEVLALGKKWYTHPYFIGSSFGKGVMRIDDAVDGFLRSLGYVHDRERVCYHKVGCSPDKVALFAHQGAGMLVLSSILDIPYPVLSTRFDFGHSSVTVISFGEEGDVYPKTLQLSNDSHLYKEGILTGYNNEIDI